MGSVRGPDKRARERAHVLAVPLLLALFGCGTGAGTGSTCTADTDCADGLLCVDDASLDHASCLVACDAATTRLCSNGLVCLAFAAGDACYPGGDVGYHEACTDSLECEGGTVCPAAQGICLQACSSDNVCESDEACADSGDVGAVCS